MNQEQFLGIVRAVVPAVLAYAVGAKLIDAGVVGDITAAVVTLASVGWSIATHTQKATVAAVAKLDKTQVTDNGKTIKILDPVLADAAKENATPPVH